MKKSLSLSMAVLLLSACGGSSGPAFPVPAKRVAPLPASTMAAPTTAAPTTPGSDASSLSVEDVGSFVRARQPQLHYCYQQGLEKNPALAGSATVSVTLAGDGKVKNVGVLERTWAGKGVKEAESCIRAKIFAWNFPPSESPESTHSFLLSFTR